MTGKPGPVLAEYLLAGGTVWHTVIGPPGATLAELEESMRRQWPLDGFRPRELEREPDTAA